MTIIGISGKSGAGKTSLLHAIKNKFTTGQICIISLDNYYKKRSEQIKDSMGYYNFDVLSSFNWAETMADIKALRSGNEVCRTRYNFNNEVPVDPVYLQPAEVLIIEGIFIFSKPEIWEMLDYSIIIEAPDELCLKRRLARDMKERNYVKEEILHRFNNHFLPAYRTWVEPMKTKVNLVLYNEDLEIATKILVGKIASFLEQS